MIRTLCFGPDNSYRVEAETDDRDGSIVGYRLWVGSSYRGHFRTWQDARAAGYASLRPHK